MIFWKGFFKFKRYFEGHDVKDGINIVNGYLQIAELFGEYKNLALKVLPFAVNRKSNDGAHDFSHLTRVWFNVREIFEIDGGNLEILVAAVILHDCVSVEKDSSLRNKASFLAAKHAEKILEDIGWTQDRCSAVAHAIEAHSFSAGVEPRTLEACILQDADRLDALGLIGVARCFYTAGRMGTQLYSPVDPKGENRQHEDKCFALDHFPRKLLKLCGSFRTKRGSEIANQRHQELLKFYNDFLTEVSCTEGRGRTTATD